MGFQSTFDDLVGSLSNIGGVFGVGSHPYPSDFEETNTTVQENDGSWKKSRGYGFRVCTASNTGEAASSEEHGAWKDFILQINPQNLSQDEIFAIEVTPTFSGVMVEHQGTTLKDIVISGTTGISPNRRAGGAFPQTGAPAFGDGRSGYYEFQELRSYFRAYVEKKRKNTKGDLRLVFMNYKDAEYLFVEPQKFTMVRNASKPFMYDYSISLKAIGVVKDELLKKNALDYVDKAFEIGTEAIDAATSFIVGGIGWAETVNRELKREVLSPLYALSDYHETWKRTENRRAKLGKAQIISREELKTLYENIVKTNDNAADAAGVDTTLYNEMKGRTNTSSRAASVLITSDKFEVMNGLKKAAAAVRAAIVRAQADAVKNDNSGADTYDLSQKIYANAAKTALAASKKRQFIQLEKDLAFARRVGDKSEIEKVETKIKDLNYDESETDRLLSDLPAGSDKVVITGGMSIQRFAEKYGADWKQIVIRNNLKHPYINPTPLETGEEREEGVLYVGDEILIPRSKAAIETGVFITQKQKNLFGTDIKLDENNDIALDPATNDVKTVEGVENLAQAIITRILMQRGALLLHPNLGTDLEIGEKSINTSDVSYQIRKTLETDDRIDPIIYVGVTQESSAVSINMVVRLKGSDLPVRVPITFAA